MRRSGCRRPETVQRSAPAGVAIGNTQGSEPEQGSFERKSAEGVGDRSIRHQRIRNQRLPNREGNRAGRLRDELRGGGRMRFGLLGRPALRLFGTGGGGALIGFNQAGQPEGFLLLLVTLLVRLGTEAATRHFPEKREPLSTIQAPHGGRSSLALW
ncbi:MAG: hypothetical protein KIT09_20730 [Bryobacteraceae bacterium]|nr:hypothetical protein [Bryobacteraceae bacterium]